MTKTRARADLDVRVAPRLLVTVLWRRWYIVMLGLIATGAVVLLVPRFVPATYEADARFLLLPPETVRQTVENPYLHLGAMSQALEMLAQRISAEDVRETVGAGLDGSFEAFADRAMSGPVLALEVRGEEPAAVKALMGRASGAVPNQLEELQVKAGVPERAHITTTLLPVGSDPHAVVEDQRKMQVLVGLAGISAACLAAVLVDRRLRRRRVSRAGVRAMSDQLAALTALSPWDAVTVLTVYLVAVFAIPSDRTVAQLGAAGSPAVLLGLALLLWWCWSRLHRATETPSREPVRIALFVLLGAALASYAAAMLRPIPTIELSTADSGLLRLLGWSGVLLVAHDGMEDPERLLVLIRRLVVVGGLFAILGLVQFATGQSFVDRLEIPGLASGQAYSNVQNRAGFARPAGTAMHALEYATVLSMVLPLALNWAVFSGIGSRFARWWPVAAIALALVLSVSRSGLLGMVAAFVVIVPAWSKQMRRWLLVAAAGLAVGVYALVPGMIGTLIGLFGGTMEDPSALSRTSSYDLAGEFFVRAPVLGRGFGTFLPEYRIFDNQYLQLLLEMGLVGVLAFMALIAAGVGAGLSARQEEEWTRQLGRALAASVVAGAVLTAFFDAFSFPKAVAPLFLVLGIAGAFRRQARELPPFAAGRSLSWLPA